MKCPHCRVEIHEGFTRDFLRKAQAVGSAPASNGAMAPAFWAVTSMACPSCNRAIIRLELAFDQHSLVHGDAFAHDMVYPRGSSRVPAPSQVPPNLAEDFDEASMVLADSPKASAALSRRCLQAVLRAQGYTQHDLAPAIDAALNSKTLPSHIADNLDVIRNIGNFAAHPMKNTNSGEVLPVEPHEAEWNLDVLEGLFDFYYVQPAKAQARRDALNAKIATAGKPPLKT